jgi:hypothetical protein
VPRTNEQLWQMAAKTIVAIAAMWMLAILMGSFLHSGL